MALYHPGCFLQKVLAVKAPKAPRDLYTLAMSRIFYKEITKTIMITKYWTYKVGLARSPNNVLHTSLTGEIHNSCRLPTSTC